MVVIGYTDEWEKNYHKIKKVLARNSHNYSSINHIGSTSIKGMIAKPIIDIDIAYNKNSDFDKLKNELMRIGYFHNGNQGIDGREVFKRNGITRNEILDSIKHHLYVCHVENEEFIWHILFRDYLKKHKEKAERYCMIKMEILNKYGHENREKYVEVKETEYRWFINEVIELARREKEK